jgi:hypothetical protein
LFNLLLRFNKYGRYALSRDQRRASNWFGLCLAAFVAAVIANVVWGSEVAFLVAGFAVGMALPLVTIYQCDIGWPRQSMTTFTAAMAAVGTLAIVFSAIGHDSGSLLVGLFLIGFIATPWVANYLATATATR